MRGPVTWMARNHVAANLLMGFLLLSGALAIGVIKKETFPEISLDQVQIQVPYLGASPEEVEEGVCQRIEERLLGLEGIRRVRSTAAEGVGIVSVELELGTDMSSMLDDIKNEIDRIETFPAETEQPVIKDLVRRNQVIDIVVYGDVPEKVLKTVAERVRDDMRTSPGISQVELAGVRRDEISIEVSEFMLRRHRLTLAQVSGAVRRASLDLPGGSVKSEAGEILVRTKGLKYSGRDYEDVVVFTSPDGTSLKLGQIATIVDGFENSDLISRYNGHPAAVVQVYRSGNQSALEIAAYAKEYLIAQEGRLPAGVMMDVARDDSVLLLSRLDLLLRNARLGLVFVFICLSLFLDLRLAFWVMMGIPISLMGSFLLIQPFDLSINMISLFAFIVALGIVVDDAIVIGENVFAHREQGKGILAAAIDGTLEVAKPVVFSVMTSVVAFLPLVFVEGTMGKFMFVIPVIVISMLLISLVEALLILPAHLSRGEGSTRGGVFSAVFRVPIQLHERLRQGVHRRLRAFIEGPYTRVLRASLSNPLATAALGVALMMATLGWIAGGHVKFVFMPKIDSDWLIISLVMPQGTTVEQTEVAVKRLEQAAMAIAQEYGQERSAGEPSVFRSVFTIIGDTPGSRRASMGASQAAGGQGHIAEITIELLPSELRQIPSADIARRVRERVGEVPGAESVKFTSAFFTAGAPIEVQLASADFPQLLQAADRLKAEIAGYAAADDIEDSFQDGKLEMKLALTPQGRTLGITLADLARQVRQGFYGDQALRIQRGTEDVRVMVRYPQVERRTLSDIENMRIRTPEGDEVAFSHVARASLGRGYATIQRSDGQRIVSISADVDEKRGNADEINRDLKLFLPRLIQDYPGLRYSYEGEQRERADSFASLKRGFIVALFAIYALLAIPFRSYLQPFVIMAAIPFGIIGAVWGHALMGIDLALLSVFGMVALSGVVVNDSLILLSFYNDLREGGMERDEALIEAGRSRFRPILLTSLTTFFALLPMILEKSVQAQFLIPMAVSLAFGILFATGIILVGVPSMMKVVAQLQALAAPRRGRVAVAAVSAEPRS